MDFLDCGRESLANEEYDICSEQSSTRDSDSLCGVSKTLVLPGAYDEPILQASSRHSKTFDEFQMDAALQKADLLFTQIMDPNNQETRDLMETMFNGPMKAMMKKAMLSLEAIDVQNPEEAKEQLELFRSFLEVSGELREECLAHVYTAMEKQMTHFENSVDLYNAKMKDTVQQAIEIYKERINVEVEVRRKVLETKQVEAEALLAFRLKEADMDSHVSDLRNAAEMRTIKNRVEMLDMQDDQFGRKSAKRLTLEADREAQKLKQQQARADQEHQKAMRDLERSEKKAQQEQDRVERKAKAEDDRKARQLEQEIRKEQAKLEREKKQEEQAYRKAVKEVDVKAKTSKISQEARDAVMKEFEIEMRRYNTEFNLAQAAMKDALSKGRSMEIKHHAPKVEWSTPPKVVPGSVEWKLR